MRRIIVLVAVLLATAPALDAQRSLAKDGTMRAAYLASNPAQAVKDPATGEVRGVVVDLVRELERVNRVRVTLVGLESPQRVIDAVRNGDAEIGFVAYNPERAGPVEFSQPYLLVQQTFIVRDDSRIRSVKDIDRTGTKLGATRADSIALYLRRTLKQAELVELDGATQASIQAMLRDGKVDAFGANRQRLTDMVKSMPGVRVIADDLYGVEQTIIVPGGRRDVVAEVNQFIDQVRRSGFLEEAVKRSGIVGIAVAPGS